MRNEYIDLVLVQCEPDLCLLQRGQLMPFLCIAPAWSVKVGNIVTIEDGGKGTAVMVETVRKDSEHYKMIAWLVAGEPDVRPLRLMSAATPFDYTETNDVPAE